MDSMDEYVLIRKAFTGTTGKYFPETVMCIDKEGRGIFLDSTRANEYFANGTLIIVMGNKQTAETVFDALLYTMFDIEYDCNKGLFVVDDAMKYVLD